VADSPNKKLKTDMRPTSDARIKAALGPMTPVALRCDQ